MCPPKSARISLMLVFSRRQPRVSELRPLAFCMWGMGNVKITKEPWSAGFNPAGFAAAQRIPWPISFLL